MRALAAVSGLALVASSAALVSSPAHAADPVDIQILATNDFHGRLMADRVEAGAAKYGRRGQRAARREPQHRLRRGR